MISIAMTTYNGESYIKEQIESILSQSYSNYEIIICDDCSSDNTIQILKKYEKNDSRIKLYQNKKNLGFVKNFEQAINLCKYEFIALSDQDDVWEVNHLEILLNNIQNHSMACGNARIMNSDSIISKYTLSEKDSFFKDYGNPDMLYRILFYSGVYQGASSLYSKNLLEKALPIPSGVLFHDAWFAACALCMKGIHYTFEPITQYRMHNNNSSGDHDWKLIKQIKKSVIRKKYTTDRIIYCNELLQRFSGLPTETKNIINLAKQYHQARLKHKEIFRSLNILIKNYKKIYTTNSLKYIFLRCIAIIWSK